MGHPPLLPCALNWGLEGGWRASPPVHSPKEACLWESLRPLWEAVRVPLKTKSPGEEDKLISNATHRPRNTFQVQICPFRKRFLSPGALKGPGVYLAGSQHVCHGFAAEVGRGDHILLPAGVPGCHGFGRCHGDAFRHPDGFFRRAGLLGNVLGLEHLETWRGGEGRSGALPWKPQEAVWKAQREVPV